MSSGFQEEVGEPSGTPTAMPKRGKTLVGSASSESTCPFAFK